MEHLLYHPSARTFRAEIRDGANGTFAVTDWALRDRLYGGCTPVSPRVPWLEHDHAGSSYLHSSNYNPLPMDVMFRDLYGVEWNIEDKLDPQHINQCHPSLKDLDVAEAARSTAAFIQSWLYFGLLEAICARPISISYLTRPSPDQRKWMYSQNLTVLLEIWRRGLDVVEDDFREATLRKARDCAMLASTILSEVYAETRKNGFSELRELIVAVEPGLSALHEAIVGFIQREMGLEIKTFGGTDASKNPFPRPYSERLIAKGWCRFVIASAEIAMSPSLLRYIDAADFRERTKGHEGCTAEQCNRNQVQLSTYKQGHRNSNFHCRFLKPSIKDVLAILDAGKIPVVQLSPKSNSLQLGAVDHDDSKADYIAFSHVWADGLGSSPEVGLPKCQISRLHHLAGQRLKYGAWFWIDGLCVPSQQPFRGKAIEMMKTTYQNATGVIVLDNGLRSLSVSASALEVGWAVFASGWFGRLWTYQEGFLPPWVDLELADGLFDLYSLIQQLYKSYYGFSTSPFPTVFVRDLLAVLQKVRPLDRQAKNRPMVKKVVDIFNAFSRRRTSRPDDQLLVMGPLLDVDVRDLMKLTGEDRWVHFYISLREIPWTVLFDRRPKLTTYPFRWAPASWISPGQDVWLHYDEALAAITHEGLKVTLTALWLDQPRHTKMPAVILEADQTRYEVTRSVPGASPHMDTFNVLFVRHFARESPQNTLDENTRMLTSVGLGLLEDDSDSALRYYDFSSEWEIRRVTEPDEDVPEDVERVKARWTQREFYFT